MIAHIIKYGERAKIQNDTNLKNLVLVHFKVQNDHFLCEVICSKIIIFIFEKKTPLYRPSKTTSFAKLSSNTKKKKKRVTFESKNKKNNK